MEPSFRHVAIIMDGNGRWAKKQNKVRTFGHSSGSENVREIAIAANDLGVEVLTLYAFSTENWKRPAEEVNFLMKLPEVFFAKFLKELMEKNIRIQTIGELEAFPDDTRGVLMRAIQTTKDNTGMILCFAMNYGARREILLAAKRFAEDLNHGKINAEADEDTFESYLMTHAYPPVDVCIRTSGEQRLSNFLLWQLAYAELVFVDEAWPEFTPGRFKEVLTQTAQRERRFGGI
ncbi:MAG: isoprenyl transferase [Erysipelotrichaceae bacterium]